jgi:putative ABC transport system substrate-binding protein
VEGLGIMAGNLGLKLRFIEVRDWMQLERAFTVAQQNDQAFLMLADALSMQYRSEIAVVAAKARIPGIYVLREFVDAGGLMSYGADNNALFRRAAEYADRVLSGVQPSDLPIEQPTKIEMVVNLKAAEALGLAIPQSILLRADEVIR